MYTIRNTTHSDMIDFCMETYVHVELYLVMTEPSKEQYFPLIESLNVKQ